jgi:3-oxoacyl-[acyl-carrier-protein] synthase-3
MIYHDVCIESLGFLVPQEVITTEELERELAPVYQRLKLPPGRLELMSGIAERRFWKRGTRPSELSVRSCELALSAAEFDRKLVGALIHGSVCRDFLEPATSCPVHFHLGLPERCVVYDTSNACLGILNGILQAANMIELGQIQAALVVGSESGRTLVETTIAALNQDQGLTRQSIKAAVASLTIGSASCAVLMTHRSLSRTQNRLLGGAALARTRFHDLCLSDGDQAGHAMQPLMNTDSEQLMQEGVRTGEATFEELLRELNWDRDSIDRTFCHQVGVAHRKLMLERLGLSAQRDFITYPWLGNTGSAALPITLAIGAMHQPPRDERLALLGIGSGINCVMLGVEWQGTRVAGRIFGDREEPFEMAESAASGYP